MKISSLKNKRAALELSIGTIVIIVLAMSMLILGLVLVRTIFSGAKYNVDALNKNVEAEINKLFNEKGGRLFVYLPNNQADVQKGKSFGIAFAIKNDVQGETQASTFTYETKAASIQTGCQLTMEQADRYVILGGSGSIQLAPGDEPKTRLIKVQPSSTAPLCEVSYDIIVKKDGQPYDTSFFILKVTG
jgi:hypothetical protein